MFFFFFLEIFKNSPSDKNNLYLIKKRPINVLNEMIHQNLSNKNATYQMCANYGHSVIQDHQNQIPQRKLIRLHTDILYLYVVTLNGYEL